MGQEIELIKNTATIHIRADLTLVQRKLADVLLYNAYPKLEDQELHFIKYADVFKMLGDKTRNYKKVKDDLRALRRADVEWNIFQKVGESEWREREIANMGILSHFRILDSSMIEYAYPQPLRKLLRHPSIYARLNLKIQNRFSSKYSSVVWQFLVDALGAKRNRCSERLLIEDLRRLMGLKEGDYKEFRVLRRSALEPALAEVNEHSDITVEADFLREGRRVK